MNFKQLVVFDFEGDKQKQFEIVEFVMVKIQYVKVCLEDFMLDLLEEEFLMLVILSIFIFFEIRLLMVVLDIILVVMILFVVEEVRSLFLLLVLLDRSKQLLLVLEELYVEFVVEEMVDKMDIDLLERK